MNDAYFRQVTLQWIKNMLLCDEVRLKDIPQEIRSSSSSIYAVAFRMSNTISCKRLVKDLTILCQDIQAAESREQKDCLVRTLADYMSINDHKQEAEFIEFQENIYEDVLSELRRSQNAVQNDLQQQLKDRGVI